MSEISSPTVDASELPASALSVEASESKPPPSAAAKLVRQASHYSLAGVLSVIAGMVTFPLLTRTLSVSDYGLLSLLTATLGIAVAIGKGGLQHAIVRFFAQVVSGKSFFTLEQLYSTALLGMLGSGLVVTLGLVVGSHFIRADSFEDGRIVLLMPLVGMLVLVQVMDSSMSNFLLGDQKSTVLLKYEFTKKYLGLGAIVVAMLLVAPTLVNFFWAKLLAECVALAVPAWALFANAKRLRPRFANFSSALYKQMLAFGLPMVIGYELSGMVLNVGDRYVIDALIGEDELGRYSAAYSLCQYAQTIFISSVGQAIMPIYMRMWDEKGPRETARFVSDSLRSYVLMGAPVIAGLASVGPELLPSLASEKYANVGGVLPWISAGMIVDGAANFLGAGLFAQRRSRLTASLVFVSAMVNLGLNMLMVPWFGVLGAAIATFSSYSFLCVGFTYYARRDMPVRFPWATALRAGAVAILMYGALHFICPGRRFLSVAVRAAIGAPIYIGVITWIDRDARALLRTLLGKIRARLAS
jgi:O-antigen/teichoic acid export membrane protein